jgi:glutamate racemase
VSSTTQWIRGQYGIPERIALIATEATVKAMYWERKLKDALPELQVLPVAAPQFVPLVEAPRQDEAAIRRSVRAIIAPLVADGINTILFGCTHYPLLSRYMLDIAPGLHFIDPAECLAERLCGSLSPPAEGAKAGRRHFFSSLPSERFYELGERVFGSPIRQQTSMYIVNPWEEAC